MVNGKRKLKVQLKKFELHGKEWELTYRALLSQSAEGIFIFDPRTRKIIESNVKLLNLLGYNEDELLRLNVQDLIEDSAYPLKSKIASASPGKVIHTPVNFKCKDGRKICAEVSASLIDCEVKQICLVNVTDVTSKSNHTEIVKRSSIQIKQALDETVNALVTISEKKDPYTYAHQLRVAKLASAIAQEMGLDDLQIEGIVIAGKLHDLGKINIPIDILAKPGILTAPEMEIIKFHPSMGYEILAKIPFEYPIANIVAQHHERWNGTGYPHHLAGEDILFEARILAVADVIEAMSSHRPYRPALGIEKAFDEITINSGILYDPRVVKACTTVLKRNHMNLEKILL